MKELDRERAIWSHCYIWVQSFLFPAPSSVSLSGLPNMCILHLSCSYGGNANPHCETWRETTPRHSRNVNCGPHAYTLIPTNTGVCMKHVLLLNNAFYVDSIKDTWAKGGGTIETPWAIC